jgi:hypothetical protein
MMMSFLQGLRQSGKTHAVMQILHDQYLRGRYAETVVVFPSADYLRWWMEMWRRRFPHTPVPPYVIIGNLLPVRGRLISLAVVEDVHLLADGIWDPRIETLLSSMVFSQDSEILFTASPNHLNARSHSRTVTSEDVMRRRLEILRKNLSE